MSQSSSKSASSSSTTYNTETDNFNLQGIGQEAQTIAGIDSSTINVTDGGIIARAFDFGGEALKQNAELVSGTQAALKGFSEDVKSLAAASASDVRLLAAQTAKGEGDRVSDVAKWTLAAAVVVAIALAVARRKQ